MHFHTQIIARAVVHNYSGKAETEFIKAVSKIDDSIKELI